MLCTLSRIDAQLPDALKLLKFIMEILVQFRQRFVHVMDQFVNSSLLEKFNPSGSIVDELVPTNVD